jgi:hypothetical protein
MSKPTTTRQQVLLAIQKSNYETFRNLVKGIELSSIDIGPFPLLTFCTDKKKAQLLIKKGAELEAKDACGRTPLLRCIRPEVAKTLVALGADVNASCHDGQTVLGRAARSKNIDLLYFLIEKGAITWSNSGNEVFTNIFKNFLRVSRKLSYSGCSTADKVLLAPTHEVTEKVKALHSLMRTDATETMELLLKAKRPLLLQILLVPAPLRRSGNCLGTNVSWNIVHEMEAARDNDTGLKIDLDQELFVDKVYIIIPNIDNDTLKRVIEVKGTVRDLFCDIHRIYEAERKDYIWLGFKGLRKELHKGETYYSLDIEVWEDLKAEPFYIRYEGSI